MSLEQRRRRAAGRLRRLVVLTALLAPTLVFPPAGAAGSSPAPAVAAPVARLTLDAGGAGLFVPGRPLPVRVQVDGDRLIRGQLEVTAGAARLSQPVEIAGGSSKRFELVVATGGGQSPLALQVSLTEPRTRLASIGASVNAAPDVELVGVAPGLLAGQPLPSQVPLSIDAGTARFVALTEQDLALAPASLGPFTAVAFGTEELGRLGSATRLALMAWTAGGGRLMVDAAPGDSVAGLPAGWAPTGAMPATAGRGEVVLTAGAMAAGKWGGLIAPAGHGTNSSQAGFNGVAEPLTSSLAGDAGLRTPRLPWLIAFLALYIVIVGPVAFLVLRRLGRAELLWAVIPVVALAFAAAGYAAGTKERSGVRIVHASVVDTTAGGGTAVSYVAVVARGEATTRFEAPAGWVLQQYSENGGPQSGPVSGLTAAAVNDGVEARLRMSAGQFAIVTATGPAHFPGQLTVTGRSTSDGHAEGTVTNNTAASLQDVSVLIGAAGTDVGTLAPGARADWVITADGSNDPTPVELQLWGNISSSGFGNLGNLGNGVGGGFAVTGPAGAVGPGGRFFGGAQGAPGSANRPASFSVWQAAPGGLAPGSRGNGLAVAVGWTGQAKSAITIGGHGPVARGRTAIVGTAPVEATSAGVGDLAIHRRVLRGDLVQVGPGMFVDSSNSGQPAVLGWSVPAAASGRPLTLVVPGNTGRVEVWGAQGWRLVTEGTAGLGPAVPPAPFPQKTPAPSRAPEATTIPAGQVPVGPLPAPPRSPTATAPSPPATASPFPAPPVPFPGVNGAGPDSLFPLAAGDIHGGAVYARIAGVNPGAAKPFDLNALTLRVTT